MKIDFCKFTALVSWLTMQTKVEFDRHDVRSLHDRIQYLEIDDLPVQAPNTVHYSLVDELLKHMQAGNGKIMAIKAYRTLTGVGLREAKDAVERYWVAPVKVEPAEPTSVT